MPLPDLSCSQKIAVAEASFVQQFWAMPYWVGALSASRARDPLDVLRDATTLVESLEGFVRAPCAFASSKWLIRLHHDLHCDRIFSTLEKCDAATAFKLIAELRLSLAEEAIAKPSATSRLF